MVNSDLFNWPVRTFSIDQFRPFPMFSSDPKQILTLANSDHVSKKKKKLDLNLIRTLANSDPFSKKKKKKKKKISLANSNLDFAGNELTSGRGPN